MLLNSFLKEMLDLQANGLQHNGIIYNVVIKAFVCDALARAWVKCMLGQSGKEACERCTVKEFPFDSPKTMIFPELKNNSFRTDKSFREQEQRQHHTG